MCTCMVRLARASLVPLDVLHTLRRADAVKPASAPEHLPASLLLCHCGISSPATVWLTRTLPVAVLFFMVVGMIAVLCGPVNLPLPC